MSDGQVHRFDKKAASGRGGVRHGSESSLQRLNRRLRSALYKQKDSFFVNDVEMC